MAVYQPDYFGFALFFLVPFAIMVSATIYGYRTKNGSERRWAWTSLLLAMNAVFMGLHYWSKAYDLPKHESQRTANLEWVAITFSVTWMLIVLIVLRRHTSKSR